MRALLLALALAAVSTTAHADPRPPGGHRIRNEAIPYGSCKKVLFYYNKFSSAYRTVCNYGFFQSGPRE
jgi:hypothetical protein